MARPAAADPVMSPSSHYATSHLSDQPLTSPAAGALASQHAPQNLPQNSAQMTRNCPQNHTHHMYYPNYGCSGQMNANCNVTTAGQTNHHSNQTCAPSNHNVQMRMTNNCQQLSPHCPQTASIPNPQTTVAHPNSQCNQSSGQCARSLVTLNGQMPNMHSAQQPSMTNHCGPISPLCSQLNVTNQGKPMNMLTANHPGCQQQTQQSNTGQSCVQLTNCVHPNNPHRQVNDDATALKRASPQLCNTQQINCRMQQQQQQQTCAHNCQARANLPTQQQYNCNCQWAYGNQCYHDQQNGPLPEIQCRDISQSQQGSSLKPPQGMRQDSYRRTLEYVQQCRNWSGNARSHETNVSSSTHPMSLPQPLPASTNMIVNDMTSSLSSLLEENRYLQMIQ